MIPEAFVDLAAFVPGVRVELRYATAHNLTGHPLQGYRAARALAVRPAAEALKKAAALLAAQGYGLLIYDAYRPQKAVDDFVRWSQAPEDGTTREEFYPELDKCDLFPLGYIALKSGHTRGATIDLTLTTLQGGPLDMGTCFDRMSDASHHDAPGLTEEQTARRELLRSTMTAAGFLPYEHEWWHYRLENEPFPDTYFDFDIEEDTAMNAISGVIFDLDGVIVSTDDCHYEAWKQLAQRECIPFTREDNRRQRGVSRMESLDILLEKAPRTYTDAEKLELADYKNDVYKQLIGKLTPADILPGAMAALEGLRAQGIKLAIGSSSRNTPVILERIGLSRYFDAVADGNQITHSKPDPEVFLLAAHLLGLAPAHCLVVEDADAGVAAAHAGGMRALAVGAASHTAQAEWKAETLMDIDLPSIAAAVK